MGAGRGVDGRVVALGLDEEVMYFMFSMNKYRKDEVFDQTLNNNFQTRRTVRDTLTRVLGVEARNDADGSFR